MVLKIVSPAIKTPLSFLKNAKGTLIFWVEFLRKINSSADKTLKIFENGYHELQHDEEVDELKKTVVDWCLQRIPKAKPFGNLEN